MSEASKKEAPSFVFSPAATRDELAIASLIGIGSWAPLAPGGQLLDLASDEALLIRAKWAYRQADAMIAARGARA